MTAPPQRPAAPRSPGRRCLLAGFAAAALAPVAAHAQARRPRIGVLMGRSADDREGQAYFAALRQGLERLGWTPARAEIDVRWLPADSGAVRAQVAELVALRPDVLAVAASVYLRAARAATTTIPIVFLIIADPVAQGFVPSLARPGGNITGFAAEEASMGGKWLELLLEIAPRVGRVHFVFNPATAASPAMFQSAAGGAGVPATVERMVAPVSSEADLERLVAEAGRMQGRHGLVFQPDPWLFTRRTLVAGLAARHAVPAIHAYRDTASAGGLISFGIDRVDIFRRSADYLHLVLNGANPGELPVQMPTRFELVVNLRAARALGLDPPLALLARADEVIE
jgi:putative ABC transport system substrate-binding protein